jgi:hypothetical protein
LQFSRREIETLRSIVKKIEENKKQEKIRIQQRRKAQLRGKTISRLIGKARKPTRAKRRVTKKRTAIR